MNTTSSFETSSINDAQNLIKEYNGLKQDIQQAASKGKYELTLLKPPSQIVMNKLQKEGYKFYHAQHWLFPFIFYSISWKPEQPKQSLFKRIFNRKIY